MTTDPGLQRRRKPTKRRGRTRISSPPSSPLAVSSARNTPPSQGQPDQKPQSNLSIRTACLPRKRKGLRAPPIVAGYDSAPAPSSPDEQRYTAETIAELKRQGDRPQPFVEQSNACEEIGKEAHDGKQAESVAVADAERALRDAKVGSHSITFGKHAAEVQKGIRVLQGAPGRPDPFSAAWRDGTIRRETADAEEDVAVVDDFTEVAKASYIPLEGDVAMKDADGSGEVEEEGSDGEWEVEQLRRAGHSVRQEAEEISQKRARQIVRAADEGIRRGGALSSCLLIAREATMEFVAKEELAKGKLRQLEEAERNGNATAVEVDERITSEKKRLAFYDGMSAHVDDIVDMLKEKEEEIVAAREKFLAKLSAEAEQVKTCLLGGTDEFGRSRLPSLEIPEAEPIVQDDVFDDVMDDVKSIECLAVWFRKWRTQYPKEYDEAFGDAGLGRLAGRMALATQDEELGWLVPLQGVSRVEALRASKCSDMIAAGIRARWKPREGRSGEKFARVAREVVQAEGDESKRMIGGSFLERVGWEIDACRKLENTGEMWRCVEESMNVIRALRWDFGILHVLKAVKDQGWKKESWDGGMTGAVRWIAENFTNVFQSEVVALAEELLAQK